MTGLTPVITIDGPTASGKGTVSQCVAEKLQWHLLDSGALYRVLSLAALQYGVPFNDEVALVRLANALDVSFESDKIGSPARVLLDGIDVSLQIRAEQHGNITSQISGIPAVRLALMDLQKGFRVAPGLVADGRDMGTVVFPDAQLKFFLTAAPAVRAERRYLQLKEKDASVTLPALIKEIRERDSRDENRSVSPMLPAKDAIVIDTSKLDINQVVTEIMTHISQVFPDIS